MEGDAGLRAGAEDMGFVVGASWSEADAGTNAPGTALTLNAPVQIFASEHFRGRCSRGAVPRSRSMTLTPDGCSGSST